MEEKRKLDCSLAVEYPQYCTPVGIAASEHSKEKHKGGAKRFVGVDLSKQSCYMCIINPEGRIVLHEKFSLRSTMRDNLYEALEEGDLVLMEASTGTFNIARAMNKRPGVVACVVNPHSIRINETKKKTDKEDSLFLARLVFRTPVEELQLVSIPSDREMADRDTVSHYRKIDEVHTQMVNRLHALLLKDGQYRRVIDEVASYKGKTIPNVVNLYTYLTNNIGNIDYKKYRDEGLYVSSGAIESSNKTVLQRRLKQAGMRWDAATAQNMVTLRAKAASGKWIEEVEHYIPDFFANLDYKDLKTLPRF